MSVGSIIKDLEESSYCSGPFQFFFFLHPGNTMHHLKTNHCFFSHTQVL